MTRDRSASGRVYDPVFIFMVIAVVLAVSSSIALRCMTPAMGPQAAQGAEGEAAGPAAGTYMQALPAPGAVRVIAKK